MPRPTQIPAEAWVAAARKSLVEEGLNGVKVDRLAKALGVTRGGFYHHFEDHEDLLNRLIDDWALTNAFLPERHSPETPRAAKEQLLKMVDRHISENEFSPAFEIAVREWARIDSRVRKTVNRVDKKRIARFSDLFSVLGYDQEEALIRAQVWYFHQIGFYSLGYHKRQTKTERKKNAPIYMQIIFGDRFIDIDNSD